MLNVQLIRRSLSLLFLMLFFFVVTGCQSGQSAAKPENATAVNRPTVRIKAGIDKPYTDPDGNVWLADTGFEGGEVVARDADLNVTNTKDPALYRTEHFSMTAFSYAVPNGKYTIKLHFAETYEEITAPGQRLFSFNVQGKEFKDVDLFVKAGGSNKAYIETVPVEITSGMLQITFTPNVENPEINAIEIIPS